MKRPAQSAPQNSAEGSGFSPDPMSQLTQGSSTSHQMFPEGVMNSSEVMGASGVGSGVPSEGLTSEAVDVLPDGESPPDPSAVHATEAIATRAATRRTRGGGQTT